MKLSVEMTVQEGGVVRESRGYLRDSQIELEDLLKWTKSQLIVISDQALREEQANGFDKMPIMLVDGRRSKRIEDVSPLGQVEFVARQRMTEVLLEAYNALLELSKVLTGRYKGSHYVFHNGTQVATDLGSLTSWLKTAELNDKDVVRIVNVQPYARRLELLGVTSTRQQSKREDRGRRRGKKTGVLVRVPNGTYQLVYRRIRSKYKQNALIRFTFLSGSFLGLSASFKYGRKGSRGRPYLYPTLVFNLQERGMLP